MTELSKAVAVFFIPHTRPLHKKNQIGTAQSGPSSQDQAQSVSGAGGQCPGSGSAVTLGAGARPAVPGPAPGPRNTRDSHQTRGTRGSSGDRGESAGPRTRTRLRPLCWSRSQIPLLCDSPSSETHGYSLGQVSATGHWTHRSLTSGVL